MWAPVVQSILVASEEDIFWVCEYMGLKNHEELCSYMERIWGSSKPPPQTARPKFLGAG